MKTLLIATMGAAALITFTPVLASAKDRGDHANKRFERLDANGDSKITLEEMLARTDARFDKADTNGDGEISVDEMVTRIERRRLERRAERMLKRMDFDGDGKVTKTELQNRAKKRFALMDRNDDGAVEMSEMRRGKRSDRRGKRRHNRGHHRRGQSDL